MLPAGPPIAPAWSSPYRLGSGLPRQFQLHVPNPAASVDFGLPGSEPQAGAAAAPEPPPAPAPEAEPFPSSAPAWFETEDFEPVEFDPPLPEPVMASAEALQHARDPEPEPEPPRAWFETRGAYAPMEAASDATPAAATPQMAPAPAELPRKRPSLPPLQPRPAPSALPADAPAWDAPKRRPGFVPAALKPRGRWGWLPFGIVVLLLPAIGAAMAWLRPRPLTPAPPASLAAVFNAPIMILRAAAAGHVESVAVAKGQPVDPGTVLLTIHTAPAPDPVAETLAARLAAAKDRLASLDATLGQPMPPGDAGRIRLAETRRLRTAASTDVASIQSTLAANPPRTAKDTPVRAGLTGRVWSVEATAGSDTAPGAALVRLVDCDHPFLTIQDPGSLQPGQTVTIRVAGQPDTTGTVRNATGVAEPSGHLVVEPAGTGVRADCPVGLSAAIVPLAGKPQA